MKTSKIIFISFFSAVGLFLLSLLIQVDPQKFENEKYQNETIALPSFNHLIVEKEYNLTLVQGLADSIKLTYEKGVVIAKPIYTMRGDTLVISPEPNKDFCFYELSFKNLKSIKATSCKFELNRISAAKLRLEGTSAEINFSDAVTLDSIEMKLLAGANFWSNNSKVNVLTLNVSKSRAEFNIDVIKELKAELLDSSELSTWKVLRSNVQTDETSRYYSR